MAAEEVKLKKFEVEDQFQVQGIQEVLLDQVGPAPARNDYHELILNVLIDKVEFVKVQAEALQDVGEARLGNEILIFFNFDLLVKQLEVVEEQMVVVVPALGIEYDKVVVEVVEDQPAGENLESQPRVDGIAQVPTEVPFVNQSAIKDHLELALPL